MDTTAKDVTDLSRRLRKVRGLHAFAELFGFDWEDGSDWTWHDVACAMADAVDATTMGSESELHICKYCKHESKAYVHHKDELNHDVYTRMAEPIPYDDCMIGDAEPMISWGIRSDAIDWADHLPRLCVTAYDRDGDETEVSIPIRHCPMCGRKLPTCLEVSG